MIIAHTSAPSLRSTSPASSAAPVTSGFEDTRAYVSEQLAAGASQLRTAIDLLAAPVPGGPVPYGSPLARHLGALVGAVTGATMVLQEALLWYGDIRAKSDLPTALVTRERAVLAHVLTGTQGLARTDGYVRAMLEMGQAPLDDESWRFQALAEAEDALTFAALTQELVSALQPRA